MQHRNKRSQSVIEYLVNYAWALVIAAIILVVLFLYLSVPAKSLSNTCAFVNGAYCSSMVLGTNTITHSTSVALFLTNLQPYPMASPKIILHVNNKNTSAFPCSPNYVPPGGSIICVVDLNLNTKLGAFVSGSLYLNATYCGLSVSSYSSTQNCSTGIQQTYVGNFAGHTTPLVSTKTTLLLTAQNMTQLANNRIDPLTATVLLLGYPLSDAEVNFTVNNTAFSVLPSASLTSSNGTALSSVSGTDTGIVKVTAHYAGVTNSININFVSSASYSH